MEFTNDKPIYLQVIEDITSRIVSGEIAAGDRLPSSRELALTYRINPNTASRVYAELERRGLVYTKRGIGTFVSDGNLENLKHEKVTKAIEEFVEAMRGLGLTGEEIERELLAYLEKRKDLK
ncbi:MAG: GntR family transcriptional regulator [Lachnospiraceae bacterium]|jgi:GntR family transcriptional regulator|nr:GntR family transcriptional regulator [Lachnospiraceae bacterium]